MKKYTFIIIVVLGAVYFYFTYIHPPKKMQIKYLIENGFAAGSIDKYIGLGNDYIFAWYKAAKKGLSTFTLAGRSYHTKGGTAI